MLSTVIALENSRENAKSLTLPQNVA